MLPVVIIGAARSEGPLSYTLPTRRSSDFEGVILSKSMEVLFRAVPPSLYLAMAMTEPEEKAERYQLMREHGISELEAAFKVAEKIDQARGIEPLPPDSFG